MRPSRNPSKSREGASTKNRKTRFVPLPARMIAVLKDHQKAYGDSLYVFPNQTGGIEGHWLRRLQKLALRAGLNCGRCKDVGEGGEESCKEHAVCQEWGLHRFRKTCATNQLHGGTNIRQIQKWLGRQGFPFVPQPLTGVA